MLKIISDTDYNILLWIENTMQCPFLDVILHFISSLSDTALIWIICAIILLCTKKYRKYGFILILALLLSFLIGNGILKPLVARIRPFDNFDFMNFLINKPISFSFPSSHTALSFASAFVLLKANKKLGICAYIIAFLIAFSQLYLFLHYPTDVLGGIVLGTLCGILSIYIFSNFPPFQELCDIVIKYFK